MTSAPTLVKRLILFGLLVLVLGCTGRQPEDGNLRFYRFARLAEKGVILQIPIPPPGAYAKIARLNPSIPRNAAEVRTLTRAFNRRMPARSAYLGEGRVVDLSGEDREQAWGLLLAGLMNPALDDADRDEADATLAGDMPDFSDDNPHLKTLKTEHFHLKWFEGPPAGDPDYNLDAKDMLDGPAVPQEVAVNLETAWDKYVQTFGREPRIHPPIPFAEILKKIYEQMQGDPVQPITEQDPRLVVLFYFLGFGKYGETNSQFSDIRLNGWHLSFPSDLRQTTPTHELFHRLQYAFDYETGTDLIKWFSEGTARWSEVFLWNKVNTAGGGINAQMSPVNYFWLTYPAVSFWTYFDDRTGLMPAFMHRVDQFNDPRTALRLTIVDYFKNPPPAAGTPFPAVPEPVGMQDAPPPLQSYFSWAGLLSLFTDAAELNQEFQGSMEQFFAQWHGSRITFNHWPVQLKDVYGNPVFKEAYANYEEIDLLDPSYDQIIEQDVWPYAANYYLISHDSALDGKKVRIDLQDTTNATGRHVAYQVIQLKDYEYTITGDANVATTLKQPTVFKNTSFLYTLKPAQYEVITPQNIKYVDPIPFLIISGVGGGDNLGHLYHYRLHITVE